MPNSPRAPDGPMADEGAESEEERTQELRAKDPGLVSNIMYNKKK